MELSDADRVGTRLLAINIRLAELDHELQKAQLRVNQLESQLEDARLAQMMGEEAGNPADIGPELERSRGSLESQREIVDKMKKTQWNVRVQHTLLRAKERRESRARAAGGSENTAERQGRD